MIHKEFSEAITVHKRRRVSGDHLEMAMQTEPIPFGKFMKTKYQLFISSRIRYSFVTTCRSQRECVEILKKKAREEIVNLFDYQRVDIYGIYDDKKELLFSATSKFL
jgi:hypothetical protein